MPISAAPSGRMAEWLCRGLQILVSEFDSRSGLHPLRYNAEHRRRLLRSAAAYARVCSNLLLDPVVDRGTTEAERRLLSHASLRGCLCQKIFLVPRSPIAITRGRFTAHRFSGVAQR